MKIPACLMLALVLAACGSEPVRKSEPGVALPRHEPPVGQPPGVAQRDAADPYADPRLDPIRDKVPLVLRANAVTAAHLGNDARPTREEKRAIRAWNEIRERVLAAAPAPSHVLMQTRVRVTRAITQLYAGQLTYADFARRLREIDALHQAAVRPRLGQR